MQFLLLILGGDVELNPGPGKCEYQHNAWIVDQEILVLNFFVLDFCVNVSFKVDY